MPIVVLSLSLLVGLGLAEIAVRITGTVGQLEVATNPIWTWVIYDPVLGRSNRPGFVSPELGFRINALGFRGDEVGLPNPPQSFRIVCLGDSATFGIWTEKPLDVHASTSYPQELQTLLRAEGWSNVEVVNAGVLGHTSAHGLAQLLARVLRLKPDVVTIRFGNNDHARAFGSERLPASTPVERAVLRWAPSALLDLHLVRLAFHAYRRAGMIDGAISPRAVPLPDFQHNLERIVAASRAAGAHVLLLDFPYRPLERGVGIGESFPNAFQAANTLEELHAIHDQYQAVVRTVAEETGTPLLESAPALHAAHREVFTDADMSHATAAGNALLARLLRDELLALGWLPPPG